MDKVGIAAITIGAGVVIAVLAIKPVTYNSALSLFENGKYEEAIEKFGKIENYQDSKQYYQYGKALIGIDEGNYAMAVSLLAELGDFKDADELEKYYQAVVYETQGDYESLVAAKELYEAVASFSDSEQRSVDVEVAIEAMYQDGMEKISSGNYDEGYAVLKEMGDYQDAQKVVTSNIYERGMAALEVDDYESAVQLFGEVEEYLDSKEQMLAAKYVGAEYDIQLKKPFALKDENDQEVKEILEHPEDYICTEEIVEQLMERAEARLEEKDIYHAKAMILAIQKGMEIFDVSDDLEKRYSEIYRYCDYLTGLQLIEDGEYEAGYGLLNLLMDYKDAKEQIAKSQYERAVAHLEAKEYDQAIQLFEDAGDYEDAKEQMKVAICQKAAVMLEEGKCREAYGMLEELGDYSAAVELLLKNKEERGVLAVEEKLKESNFYVISEPEGELEVWEAIPVYQKMRIDFEHKTIVPDVDFSEKDMDYFIDEVINQKANLTVFGNGEMEIAGSYDLETGILTVGGWKYAQQDYIEAYANELMDTKNYSEALAVYEMLAENSSDDTQKQAEFAKCVREARRAAASDQVTENKYDEKVDTSSLLSGNGAGVKPPSVK